ncbi:vacuolar protein sorting-associated protein 16B isoform X1 [Vanessa atalanta]|uniref:vacuolar protein sorting-associated protein 16B isoform X1 n=1 Tax=Vanessa atalanta TaxID=42275 RepID=UPI001FCDCFE7|nr:vacuolar protein sorting-associated protein 16B isoform X1 [Vanessa atalanta]
MADDDYWNTSETKTKAFSFDDDVLTPQEILAIGQKSYPGQSENVFTSTVSNTKTTLLPLSSLVSSKVLDLILLAQSGKDPKDKPEPEQTVAVTLKRLILGRSFLLHTHRSLKSKTELLDGAVAIGDGNAILTVVLFLIQTLNKKLVYELLSSRPLALNHYISFLQTEGKITDLTDLLTMLGRSPEAAVYQFQHIVNTQGNSVEGLLRKLNNLLSNHFNQPGVDTHQTKMVTDYVKLLEWQKCANKTELNNKSTLHCLSYCCTHHWNEGAGNMMSPLTLCQRQQVTPLQYDWVVLNVHANSNKWDIVESLFTKKDWLGRTTVSSHIPMETLLSRLSELSASKQMLATCLNKIQNSEDRLRLAQKYKVHSVVIESLAKQKDRSTLTNYKMTLNPQSEEYILADNTLRDASIKWKN